MNVCGFAECLVVAVVAVDTTPHASQGIDRLRSTLFFSLATLSFCAGSDQPSERDKYLLISNKASHVKALVGNAYMAENRSEEMSQDMPESGSADPNQSALAPGHTTDIASHPALANQTGLQHLDTRHVRLRTGDQFTESVSDYIGMFQELQIDPVYHGAFWSDVIYRYRQSTRHLPLLKRGTAVSIKTMSDDILRGYGVRIWGPNSEWRRVLAAGEDMLLYDKDGDNTR